jgi:opacity protein-like surface antigen
MNSLVKGLVISGLVALTAGQAAAQTPVSFGLGGGVTIPLGSTSDVLKTGWHGMALVRFKPAASPVGFQVDGMYQRLGFSDETEAAIGEGKAQVINGTANVVFSFPVSEETRFRPYLIGGVGIYSTKFKLDSGVDSDSESDFGFNAGAGFDVGFGGGTFFVEGRFHNVLVSDFDDTKFIPITVGLRFGGN